MSTLALGGGAMRAASRELQREALRNPLTRAPQDGGAHERRFFRPIGRELTWGLTLNK